jgi:hypothetical protein
MKIARVGICVLFAVFLCGFGCTTSKPQPDPLVGFHFSSLVNLNNNKAITDDYRDYFQKNGKGFVGSLLYFEDRAGQHAVQIQEGINGTWWVHDLIYDQDNKRIKTVKYKNGGYRS